MKLKIPKQEYTAEFKELAVKRVKAGQGIGANRRRKHFTLGYVSPVKCLENWISTQHEQKWAA